MFHAALCLTVASRPFLPRGEEDRILQESLEAVRAGGVRVVCLTGEPGAGKTTLLEHFISGIQNAPGQLVTFSACSQRLAGAEAFLPVLDSLDGLTRAGENAATVIDIREAPAMMYPAAGGPSVANLRRMAQALHRTHAVVAVSMTVWDLGHDADGQTERSCLSVLEALVGE
jgi:KaiC/GvpD/RAD55 family RecA-like ATPase